MFATSSPQDSENHRVISVILQRPAVRKALQLMLVLALAVVMLYLVTLGVKLAAGVSMSVERPEHMVRLEILDASGVKGAGAKIARQLENLTNEDLEIVVVEIRKLELGELAHSFIVSRDRDETAAKLLAKYIHLSPGDVIYEPLQHNRRQTSATLVLGQDMELISFPGDTAKEL